MRPSQVVLDLSRDQALSDEAKDQARHSQVVFVMGLHRSGTTIIYQYLAEAFDYVRLTIHDVVSFEVLLSENIEGKRGEGARRVDEYFAQARYTSRGNDDIPIGSDTAEEYGWILKRESGRFGAERESFDALLSLVAKLRAIHGTQRPIMLKNPWDVGRAGDLARIFPNARFVFVKRCPREILNSELNNALLFTQGRDPLLQLLSQGMPVVQLWTAIARILRRVIGQRSFLRLIARLQLADICSNLEKYERDREAIPVPRQHEISYADFISSPVGTAKSLCEFLGKAFREPGLEVRHSGGAKEKHAVIADLDFKLRARIQRLGLERFLSQSTAA